MQFARLARRLVVVEERNGESISVRTLDMTAPRNVTISPAPKTTSYQPSWQSGSSGRGKPNRRRR